jgi:quinol monooxygenase YgiN
MIGGSVGIEFPLLFGEPAYVGPWAMYNAGGEFVREDELWDQKSTFVGIEGGGMFLQKPFMIRGAGNIAAAFITTERESVDGTISETGLDLCGASFTRPSSPTLSSSSATTTWGRPSPSSSRSAIDPDTNRRMSEGNLTGSQSASENGGIGMNTLRVVAHLQARPDTADQLREALAALVVPTRQEAGCISYEMLEDIEDRTKFTFVEEWRDGEALEAHFETEHIQAAISRFPDLLAADLDLRKYTLVR